MRIKQNTFLAIDFINESAGSADAGKPIVLNAQGEIDPSMLTFLDWQDSVLDRHLNAPPGSPTTGARYIVAAGGTGAWNGHDEKIVEWDGSEWDIETPTKGTAIYVEDEGVLLLYNNDHPGGSWIRFGQIIDHGNLLGLTDIADHPGYLALDGTRTMTGNLQMDTYTVTSTSQAIELGTSATTGHGLVAGDTIVGNNLEVDGLSYFDDSMTVTAASGLACLTVDQNNDAVGLVIDCEATSASKYAFESRGKFTAYLSQDISDGYGLTVVRNNNDAESGALVLLVNDHASDTQPTLSLQNDGSGAHITTGASNEDLEIDPNGSGGVKVTGQIWSVVPATLTVAANAVTVDWTNGNGQVIDLEGSTGAVTVTLSNPQAGASYILKIIQGSGADNITWPATVLWPDGIAPTISTGNDDVDMVSLFWDGTNYFANIGQDYA